MSDGFAEVVESLASVDAFPERIGGREKPYLLVARVGATSTHEEWLEPGAARGFDVLLSHYHEVAEKHAGLRASVRAGVFEEYRPGPKIEGYAGILREHEALLACYTHVALFDDDLSADAEAITFLFEIADRERYRICQPSLTHNSYFSCAAFLQQRAFSRRHVTFIEMMCPVFRTDVLFKRALLFNLGYEVGIDLVWCNWDSPDEHDHAIIDEVAVRHLRPVGRLKSENGFAGGRLYEDDIHQALDAFSLPWIACVPYDGIRDDGSRVAGRLALLLAASGLATAIFKAPGWQGRLQSVLVHFKHLLFSPRTNADASHVVSPRGRTRVPPKLSSPAR